jgi:hypothetical protein
MYSVLQAVLVIRGLVIRGFDYPQLSNCVQNLLFADISLVIRGFFKFLVQKGHKTTKVEVPRYPRFWYSRNAQRE